MEKAREIQREASRPLGGGERVAETEKIETEACIYIYTHTRRETHIKIKDKEKRKQAHTWRRSGP